jgi:spore coat protein U-like protein
VNWFPEKPWSALARGVTAGLLLLALHPIAEAKNCRILLAQPIVFGNYDPVLPGNLDTTGQLTIRCSNNTPNVTIKLDAGIGGSFNPRYMQGPVDQLAYNLYLDAARISVWGDGTSGTGVAYYTSIGRLLTVPIYARTPLGQAVGPGVYSDTVVVTVEW